MATKLDVTFVSSIRKCHQNAVLEAQSVRLGFETLVNEVTRLEALCEAYEKRLTPDQITEASAEACKK